MNKINEEMTKLMASQHKNILQHLDFVSRRTIFMVIEILNAIITVRN
jgi:hypothetical protein